MDPFSRAQIGYHLLGMDPVLPLLDLVVAQCEDCHMTRLADMLEYFEFPTHKLGVPPDWDKSIAVDYYYQRLNKLKENLETMTGKKITDQKLGDAIESMNRMRTLIKEIDGFRKEHPPKIGGHDFIRLNHYSFFMDFEELIPELEALITELNQSDGSFSTDTPRILMAGNVVAYGDYIVPKLIEDSGAVIVSDFMDRGHRYCHWNVESNGNLMDNIGKIYYLDRVPPTIFQPAWNERVAHLKELIEENNIDGVVWYQLSFDEIHNLESAIVAKVMDEIDMPFLKLESAYEYTREAMGPLTTRVESFVSSIKQRGAK
jgi:benzoyl-CoA reductase subunit C